MQLFRKLAGNIFFKIILAFIALSFVLFGVSGFILDGPSAWVAKIGSKTISYSEFNKEMQKTREMVLQSNKSEEATRYLDSDQFKSDVLGRMVNNILITKLKEDIGVEASKKLILEVVAKDQNFKNKEGKFDRKLFQNFLAKNGLDEEKYVNLIQNDVVATMIIQTMSLSSPVNENEAIAREEFKQEKRLADVIKISEKNIKKVAAPNAEALNKFFEANKKSYFAPELRKVSYLRFSKNDFAKDLQVSEQEVSAEYEKNKDKFQRPESRNLYHVLFDKEESAKDFIAKLDAASNQDKSKSGAAFVKLAKELQNKDLKNITLKNVTQKDLIPDLADPVFKMAINQHSEALKSPLGFHVFFLNEIKKSEPIPFAVVQNQIKAKLLEGREEKVLQAKASEIDDIILASNSLSDAAKKFDLSANLNSVEIDQAGQNAKGEEISAIRGLEDFSSRAFALKKGESSKVFYSKTNKHYYAVKVDEIELAHEKSFDEIKSQVSADFAKVNQAEALKKLAKSIADELKANPQNAASIIAKHKLKLEKNKSFTRFAYINYQGRQIPYVDKFGSALFDLKVGQPTDAIQTGNQEFAVGILRSIQKTNLEATQIQRAKAQAAEEFRNEVLQGYNAFVMSKYPVKVNEKILGKKEQQ
ncbi:MAG: hypothetical protein EBS06_07495 [Proteobacteria bacterium]|nr:hypothetical protein [Pseudomonadota bacterium]